MITAEELRKIKPTVEVHQLEAIDKAVREAQEEGKNSIFWYDPLRVGTWNALEEAGYKVKSQNDRNETLIIISW